MLVYRLKLLFVMKIYFVVFITQLKSASEIEDFYFRVRNFNLSFIVEEDDTAIDLYKIETLLEKREFYGKIEYLVK